MSEAIKCLGGKNRKKIKHSESQPATPGSVKSSPPTMSLCIFLAHQYFNETIYSAEQTLVKNARLIVLSGPIFLIEEMFLRIAHFLEFQFKLSCIDFFVT